MTPTEIQLQRQICRTSFKHFVEYFWEVVINNPYSPGIHTEAMIHHLDCLNKGIIKRLVILAPIRHSKSTILSILFPVWAMIRQPEVRILTTTYKQELTKRDSEKARRLMESEKFKSLYGNVFSLDTDQNTKEYYLNDKGGYRMSQSIQGGLGGMDADLLIFDDLHSISDRKSPIMIDKACDYFNMCMKRLVLSGNDRCVLAGHRVGEDDVFSRLKSDTEGQTNWCWLILPAEYEEEISKDYYNPIWKDPRKEGELLWAEWYTKEKLDEEKKSLKYEYPAIFQQCPKPVPGENLLQRIWFNYFTIIDNCYKLGNLLIPIDDCRRIVCIDLAISESTTADSTSAMVCDVTPHNSYIFIDLWNRRSEAPGIIAQLKRINDQYKPECFYVESIGYQQMMVQMLRQEGLAVRELSTGGKDKTARASRFIAKAESGQVWLPEGASWIKRYLDEVCRYPFAAHDDDWDSSSYCCIVGSRFPIRELTKENQIVKGACLGDTHQFDTKDEMSIIIYKLRRLEKKYQKLIRGLRGSIILLSCEKKKEYQDWVAAYTSI